MIIREIEIHCKSNLISIVYFMHNLQKLKVILINYAKAKYLAFAKPEKVNFLNILLTVTISYLLKFYIIS